MPHNQRRWRSRSPKHVPLRNAARSRWAQLCWTQAARCWRDASAHAELLALRAAAAVRKAVRLPDCELVVTLEPCPMCAQAASFFRVRRLVFGAYDPKGGGIEHGARVFDASSCLWRPEVVGGVREAEATALLRAFFTERR
jgi:tRNA(adenine34) deaminase